MNVQMPAINLNGIIPTIALALLLRSILHSRVALLIAVVAGIVLAGPALAFALERIVGALVPLGMVLIVGGVIAIWLLQRNSELMSLVKDVLTRKSTITLPSQTGQQNGNNGKTVIIDQLPAQRQTVPVVRRARVDQDADRWGF